MQEKEPGYNTLTVVPFAEIVPTQQEIIASLGQSAKLALVSTLKEVQAHVVDPSGCQVPQISDKFLREFA